MVGERGLCMAQYAFINWRLRVGHWVPHHGSYPHLATSFRYDANASTGGDGDGGDDSKDMMVEDEFNEENLLL